MDYGKWLYLVTCLGSFLCIDCDASRGHIHWGGSLDMAVSSQLFQLVREICQISSSGSVVILANVCLPQNPPTLEVTVRGHVEWLCHQLEMNGVSFSLVKATVVSFFPGSLQDAVFQFPGLGNLAMLGLLCPICPSLAAGSFCAPHTLEILVSEDSLEHVEDLVVFLVWPEAGFYPLHAFLLADQDHFLVGLLAVVARIQATEVVAVAVPTAVGIPAESDGAFWSAPARKAEYHTWYDMLASY